MPRDPARIAPLLKELETLWLNWPDLRLGQMVQLLTPAGEDAFYTEDAVWLERIQAKLEMIKMCLDKEV